MTTGKEKPFAVPPAGQMATYFRWEDERFGWRMALGLKTMRYQDATDDDKRWLKMFVLAVEFLVLCGGDDPIEMLQQCIEEKKHGEIRRDMSFGIIEDEELTREMQLTGGADIVLPQGECCYEEVVTTWNRKVRKNSGS